jgi:surface antigen
MQQATGRILANGAMIAAFVVASALPLSAPMPAEAAPAAARSQAAKPAQTKGVASASPIQTRPAQFRGPVLQCVTFARDASGIHISGNAHAWWYNASGQFLRGQRPERGAVLNFRASGGMRLGHVSVVSRVISEREILIDDANWAAPGQRKGMVRRNASVIDVSPNNDWTEVRVANGVGSWGRVYPTFGFIYPRADRGADRIEIAAARDATPSYRSRAPLVLETPMPTRLHSAQGAPGGAPISGNLAVPTPQGWAWVLPAAAAAARTSAQPPTTQAPTTQAPTTQAAAPQRAAVPAPGTLRLAPISQPAPASGSLATGGWTWVNGVAVPR